MAKTFLDFWSELIGYVGPGLDPDLAKTLIQRAHKDILESRNWSFLIAEGVLNAPTTVTAGTVTVNQYATTVQADATAQAALTAISGPVLLGTRQFRISSTGRIYNIDSYDSGTGVLTLKEPFSETSVAGSAYSVFKCYYTPPDADFMRFLSVRDLTDARSLRLNMQRIEVDRRDPQRTTQEPVVAVVAHKTDADNNPVFELWPHPTSNRGYVCAYLKRGTVLEDDLASLPPSVPDELLMVRAQYHLAKWAEMNKGRDPGLRSTDWRFIMSESLARYNELLLKAKVKDDELFVQNVILPKRYGMWPPSASALQDRDYWPW